MVDTTPSGGARRGPRAAALPRRGSPGPTGARRGDLRAAPGAVGRQGAVCPRLAGAGPRGEVPARSTPRQLVEAARRARAVPGRRSDPPACSRDSVGPAQAPQTRPEGARAFLRGVCPRAFLLCARFWPTGAPFRPVGGLPRRTSTPSAARRGPRAAARPRRGSPGLVGARQCDLRAVVGAVGWQGAACPRR